MVFLEPRHAPGPTSAPTEGSRLSGLTVVTGACLTSLGS
jgi:hypothetical protein